MLEVTGGIKTQWETHRGGVPQLGLWSLAGTIPEKLGSWVTSGDGRRGGLRLILTQVVSGLVRELGCVKSLSLLRTVSHNQGEFV